MKKTYQQTKLDEIHKEIKITNQLLMGIMILTSKPLSNSQLKMFKSIIESINLLNNNYNFDNIFESLTN